MDEHKQTNTMKNSKLIQKIKKSLMANHLTIGEDTFQSYPIHEQISDVEVIVIETIYVDRVECIHYINNDMVDTMSLSYEEISLENLELILENIEEANGYLLN